MSIRLAVAALAVVLAGCSDDGSPDGPGQASRRPPPEVGVVELEARELELFTALPGRTTAYRIAEVRPQVGGILQERAFRQGARVEKGEVLYRIDPRRYRAAVANAEAELARARAAERSARLREQRLASLVEDGAVSEQEYDDAEAALDERRAEVEVAEAALESARIDLDYATVEAPIGGRIGPTLVSVGALVTEGQDRALARITQLHPMYVDIQRSVRELRRLRQQFASGALERAGPGRARVTLLLAEGMVYPHTGELEVRDVTVNESTGSVILRALFPNPDKDLLPGTYVRACVSEGVRERAILAPQQGVSRNRRGEPTALVVDDGGEVERRRLVTERAIGSFWLVDEGLEPGDRLIVTGLQKVSPGDAVEAVSADIPNPPSEAGETACAAAQAEATDSGDG